MEKRGKSTRERLPRDEVVTGAVSPWSGIEHMDEGLVATGEAAKWSESEGMGLR